MIWRLLFFILSWQLMTSCSKPTVFKEHPSVFKVGDESAWADPTWDDSNWTRDIYRIPDGQVFWSRTQIDLLEAPKPDHSFGIELLVYGAYEVFWDGEFIGRNGHPGEENLESPEGSMWQTLRIPEKLSTPGKHVLALKTSVLHYPDHLGIYSIDIADYQGLLQQQTLEAAAMHLLAGAFLIAAIYYFFLFLSHKKEYATLLFSICCFLFFTLLIVAFSKAYFPVHYSWHVLRLKFIGALMLGISFLIPLYFSKQFPFPKRPWVFIIYGALLLYFFFSRHVFELVWNNMSLSMWILSFAIVGLGVYKKIKGAALVLVSLIMAISIGFVTPFNKSLFVGFSCILLGMFYLLSLRIKEQRLAYETSLVQSTRLRLELLKKNIQPHFLMNTLTSLIDWIEESPKEAVLFIEALAHEFDLLIEMETQTLIPIAQEIALCKTHLDIMEFRHEIQYSLEMEGIDYQESIPPGVLHTLLENAITHGLPLDEQKMRFKLIYEAQEHYKRYTFLSFAKTFELKNLEIKEGTGIQYIKARLTESYQDSWTLKSEPVSHGWKSSITLYN